MSLILPQCSYRLLNLHIFCIFPGLMCMNDFIRCMCINLRMIWTKWSCKVAFISLTDVIILLWLSCVHRAHSADHDAGGVSAARCDDGHTRGIRFLCHNNTDKTGLKITTVHLLIILLIMQKHFTTLQWAPSVRESEGVFANVISCMSAS